MLDSSDRIDRGRARSPTLQSVPWHPVDQGPARRFDPGQHPPRRAFPAALKPSLEDNFRFSLVLGI